MKLVLATLIFGVAALANSVDVPGLYGDSPSELASEFGVPVHSSPAPEASPYSLRDDVFSVTVGATTGSLAVTYCDDQAFAFEMTLASGESSAADLLTTAGFSASALTLEDGSSSFARWTGSGTDRLVTTATEAGWDRLEVEYDSFGC